VTVTGVESLDHLGLVARGLDAAAATYRALGFTLTPRSRHSGPTTVGGPLVPWGTGNHCAMFRSGYLELIAVVDPSAFANRLPELLARYEGVHIVAFGCADAAATRERLVAAGFETAALHALERAAETPQGVKTARFGIVRVPAEQMPEGRVIVIQHHTPDVLWQPHLLDHPNGAVALAEVLVCVGDVEEAARRYARLLGMAPRPRGAARVFSLPRGRLAVVGADQLAAEIPDAVAPTLPYVAAFTVATRSLDATRAFLTERRVPVAGDTARAIVPAVAAKGVACVFEAAASR
jgi:hypothetical protein